MAKRSFLKQEDFRYADALGLPLPQLVLGLHVAQNQFESDFAPRDHRFKAGRKWLKIAHQAAGLACHQHYWVGTLLTPKDEKVAAGFVELSRNWLGSSTGVGGVSLTELSTYAADLKRLFGVTCDKSYRLFEEAHYPVDVECLPLLAADDLDLAKLDELIAWDSGMERAFGALGRWNLCILGRNSD